MSRASGVAGRVALVTGAGRGVGRAVALLLAGDGARLVLNDLDAEEVEQVAAQLRRDGADVVAVAGDVADPAFPEALIRAAIDGFGELDIVINNAGYIWNGAIQNHSDEQWQAMLDVHATAPFRMLRAWAPWLRATARREIERDGVARCRKVVNVSSVSGTRGAATQVAYSAAKAAVTGLTRTLAQEWGRYNVCVNAVAFGHIETRLTQRYEGEPPTIEVAGRAHRVGLNAAQLESVRASTPLGRAGTPEDAAGAIYLFCIPQSDFVSGEVLTCAGGG